MQQQDPLALPGRANSGSSTERAVKIKDFSLNDFMQLLDLNLKELDKDGVAALVAAKNGTKFLRNMHVPRSEPQSSGEVGLVQQRSDYSFEDLDFERGDLGTIPSGQMEVTPAHRIEDLPHLLPEELFLTELDDDEFLRRLMNGELSKISFREDNRETVGQSDRIDDVQEAGNPNSEAHHACVLLDNSFSMNNWDKRGVVGKGLAVGFLIHGYQQNARLNFRDFTTVLGDLDAGQGLTRLRQITERIFKLEPDGNTNIQRAVEAMVKDVQDGGGSAGATIVLITDGLSDLTKEDPLKGAALHSFVLGDTVESVIKIDQQRTRSNLSNLKNWSEEHGFWAVGRTGLKKLLIPDIADLERLAPVLTELEEELDRAIFSDEVELIKNAIENIQYLFELLEESEEEEEITPVIEQMKNQLGSLEEKLAQPQELLTMQARELVGEAEVQRREKLLDAEKRLEALENKHAGAEDDVSLRGSTAGGFNFVSPLTLMKLLWRATKVKIQKTTENLRSLWLTH